MILICSGTGEQAAYEDTLAAGALGELLAPMFAASATADSVHVARHAFRAAQNDLLKAMEFSSNGRRLLANPELAPDVEICLRRDTLDFNSALMEDGYPDPAANILSGWEYRISLRTSRLFRRARCHGFTSGAWPRMWSHLPACQRRAGFIIIRHQWLAPVPNYSEQPAT